MPCEILEYSYNLNWDLDALLENSSFLKVINPNYPLIVSTFSALNKESQTNSWIDFLNKKRRGRPSELRSISEDSVVSYVSQKLNLKKQVIRTSAECASSLYSLYIASIISKEEKTPVVVFCGDNKNADYDLWYFKSFGALDNETGLPFDKLSKGFKMGSCCTLFLVKDTSIKTPNLESKAVINKFYFHTNAANIANPGSIDDIVKNIGDINYKSFDFWNAHATGTPIGDRAEYELFSSTVKKDIPIVSYKGYTGHCMGGAGAIEIIYSLEDKKNKILRPNIIRSECVNNDPRIITSPVSFTFNKMLKINLGFGGKTIIADIDLC